MEAARQHLYQTLRGMYQPSHTKRSKLFIPILTPSPSMLDACLSQSKHRTGSIAWKVVAPWARRFLATRGAVFAANHEDWIRTAGSTTVMFVFAMITPDQQANSKDTGYDIAQYDNIIGSISSRRRHAKRHKRINRAASICYLVSRSDLSRLFVHPANMDY